MRWLILFLFFSKFVYADVVICIHGFMRTEKCMSLMASSLEKEGFTVYNWSYPSRQKLIEEHAVDLNRYLHQTVIPLHPNEPIHFVTHSLGGIILRASVNLETFPTQAKKGKAVLIAPPNQGSTFAHFLSHIYPVARLIGRKDGAELLERKDFSHLGNFPPEMKIAVISGVLGCNPFAKGFNDGKVGVRESCLSTPHQHHTIMASHSWICYSPMAIRIAKNFLQSDI